MLWLTSTKVFALLQGVTCDWIKLPQLYPRAIHGKTNSYIQHQTGKPVERSRSICMGGELTCADMHVSEHLFHALVT